VLLCYEVLFFFLESERIKQNNFFENRTLEKTKKVGKSKNKSNESERVFFLFSPRYMYLAMLATEEP